MSEWIEWKGGECPVPAGTAIEYRVLNGSSRITEKPEERMWAKSDTPWTIVAYRVLSDGIQYTETSFARDKQVAGLHYKEMGVEPWDVVDTWPREQRIGAYRHGALKYLMRMGSKDESAQEIAKGLHYMEKLLEVLRADAKGN